jgi:predicted RNase H-like nuclease (RuvC/YqgF family)
MSADIRKQLEEKRAKLEELKASKPKANCSTQFSSEADVRRETEIEDLEEEIRRLESHL